MGPRIDLDVAEKGFSFLKYATGLNSLGNNDDIYFIKFGKIFPRNFSTSTDTALLIEESDCRTGI
jgi:hypothetical protein